MEADPALPISWQQERFRKPSKASEQHLPLLRWGVVPRPASIAAVGALDGFGEGAQIRGFGSVPPEPFRWFSGPICGPRLFRPERKLSRQPREDRSCRCDATTRLLTPAFTHSTYHRTSGGRLCSRTEHLGYRRDDHSGSPALRSPSTMRSNAPGSLYGRTRLLCSIEYSGLIWSAAAHSDRARSIWPRWP
jgi:hypothetical protein